MAWTMETRLGFVWATVIVILFLASAWAMVAYRNLVPMIIPVLAYFGFLGWLNRVK